MRKINFAIIVLLAFILLPSARVAAQVSQSAPQIMLTALAEPGSPVVGKSIPVTSNLNLVVGYRLWLASWQTNVTKLPTIVADPHTPTDRIAIKEVSDGPSINKFGAASIPSLGARYGNFFASASVMISPDYHFPKKSQLVQGPTSFLPAQIEFGDHTFRIDHNVTGSRNEVDINLGYYIHPSIALTVGYKGVFQKFVDKTVATNLTHAPVGEVPTPVVKSNPRYHGGTLGIAANLPIPEGGWIPAGFLLYGNGGGGYMGSNEFASAWYGTLDAGLAYKPTSLPLLFTAGYKFQIINSKTKSNAFEDRVIDYTRGAIFGINFLF